MVVFHPLGQNQIRSIVDIQIGYLRKRLADREIGLEVSILAMDRLNKVGFDSVYGARPLKRAIQQELENSLALSILADEFSSGDTVEVDFVKEGSLLFFKKD